MASSNFRRNKAFIDQYRKELKAMLDDIRDVDEKVIKKAVGEGIKIAKDNTNVVSGKMEESWKVTPTVKNSEGVEKGIVNTKDYSSYVNYGHRLVNKSRETVGFVKGQYMLEKAIDKVEKTMVEEFKKEIEKVKRKHDS